MSEIDILSFGETMAMFVADHNGDLANVDHFHKRIAGADSNVAIGLSRLGFKVAWLSRVGGDSLGRFVVDTLQKEGLDCRHVDIDPAHPTGFQLKSRTDDGDDPRVEYFRRGSAASFLAPQSIVAELLGARHLHATGIVPALSDSARQMSFELMTRMREAGRSVSFDPNLRPSLWASERQMITEINRLAALAHWVLPGLSEGRLLTGFEDPADIAAFYLDQGAEAVPIRGDRSVAFGWYSCVPDWLWPLCCWPCNCSLWRWAAQPAGRACCCVRFTCWRRRQPGSHRLRTKFGCHAAGLG